MAYEKKIEPIARWEVLCAGITLQLWFLFVLVLPSISVSDACWSVMVDSDVSNAEDMSDFHDCIEKHRSGFLIACALTLLGFPIIIAHLFYYHRIAETIDSFLNFGLSNWLYIASWGIFGIISSTIIPAFGIFIVYYDWQFSDGYEYVGYSLQFQFFELWLISYDCIIIPLGFACSMPWLRALLMLFNCFESAHYKVSEKGKEEMLGKMLTIKCGKCIFGTFLSLFVLTITFGAMGDALDFAKDGFFSYKGGSQFLQIIVYIAMELQSLWYFRFACEFDKNLKFLDSNVELRTENSNNSIQMT